MHVRKAMIELGPDEALTYTPGWRKTLSESCQGNAMIATTGDPEPELLADVDGERVGRAVQQELSEIRRQQMRENTVNWCGIGAPARPGHSRSSASRTSSACGRRSRSA